MRSTKMDSLWNAAVAEELFMPVGIIPAVHIIQIALNPLILKRQDLPKNVKLHGKKQSNAQKNVLNEKNVDGLDFSVHNHMNIF
jgi:hypothetical protein